MLAPRAVRALGLVLVAALLTACNGQIEVRGDRPGGQDAGGETGGDGGGGGGSAPDGKGGSTGPSGDRDQASGDGGGKADAIPPATGPPGSFATALLGSGSERLVVEVLAQEGAAPRAATLAHLTEVLRDVTGKQVSTATRAVPGGGQTWSAAALRGLAERHGEARQGGGQVAIRLLFLRGRFADEKALGVAVQGDLAAVFPDQVARAGSLLTGAGAVEDAVTMHEVGHLLGLVDLVLRTGRADPEHPGHSPNRSSVMYWAVESTLIADVLTGGPPRDFDDRDRADLAAIKRRS